MNISGWDLVAPRMFVLTWYCRDLDEMLLNQSLAALNMTSQNDSTESPDAWNSTATATWMGFNETNITSTVDPILEDILKWTSKTYFVSITAGAGVIFNLILFRLLSLDPCMRECTRLLLKCVLLVECFYLTLTVAHLELRSRILLPMKLDSLTYSAILWSMSQFGATWLLLLAAKDSYRDVRMYACKEECFSRPNPHFISPHTSPPRPITLCHTRCYITLVFFLSILFHVPYIPFLRTLLNVGDPDFYPCNLPVQMQWDIHQTTSRPRDLYHVLYFCGVYWLFMYGLPFFFLGHKDKRIVDLLHGIQANSEQMPKRAMHASITALNISAIVNIYLFCNTPKQVVLIFRLFDYGLLFMHKGFQMFQVMNSMSNMLLVARPLFSLPVFIIYNGRIRSVICKSVTSCCGRRYRRYKKEPEVTICIMDTEMKECNITGI